eukprot:gnl/TRDRNA2_/TRDRNA2_155997_c0_seq1.p1 gnl/TRDRNA2_/TRDRNA2_155997_c0~~gnl/TRDRNA2_/TRDRNA2_155997_c0_seq1.p1  ORF type:complete len:175 (+),score=17.23 gnl/TRDRNA2_/TRDRNA2_155997_c0_seq1:39-563(+)
MCNSDSHSEFAAATTPPVSRANAKRVSFASTATVIEIPVIHYDADDCYAEIFSCETTSSQEPQSAPIRVPLAPRRLGTQDTQVVDMRAKVSEEGGRTYDASGYVSSMWDRHHNPSVHNQAIATSILQESMPITQQDRLQPSQTIPNECCLRKTDGKLDPMLFSPGLALFESIGL